MALTKRGKTWHTHFFLDGQRFRQSLDTSDWREAQAKEKALISAAQAGKLLATKNAVAKLSFSDAAARFLEDRLSHLAPRSVQTERERTKAIHGDVHCGACLTEDVGTLLTRTSAGEADCARFTVYEAASCGGCGEQNRGLRHKERHKRVARLDADALCH